MNRLARLLLALSSIAVVASGLCGCSPDRTADEGTVSTTAPAPTFTPRSFADAPVSSDRDFLVPARSSARDALDGDLTPAERAATAYLAAQPTASWLTPEQYPIGAVGDAVDALTAQADAEEASLAIVVYGIPDRDCDNHSAGGLSPNDYRLWVAEIAHSLGTADDVPTVVVLEPDSLALLPDCGDLDRRASLLRGAVALLADDHVRVYLDGGHSSWLPPDQMAELIAKVDVAGAARGFATNVSNYRTTADEVAYAHEVAAHLDGMHAIIDTSRNGAGPRGAEWCNPPDREVGDPAGRVRDAVVDTNLWIKPPGESDGTCHGGPPAGDWWPAAAVELTDDTH